MKPQIYNRLQNITDLNERRLLKDVLLDVYENVVTYNMDMYDKLENRLYTEIDNPLDNFAIYTTLESTTKLDPVSEFFHPMIPADSEETIDLATLSQALATDTNPTIASIFLKRSNADIDRFLAQNKTFTGTVVTNKSSYSITTKAKRCTKYTNKIEELYRLFQKNNVVWTTVNCPYAYKFVDIVLISPITLGEGETITEITVNLGEYDQYKQVNVVPLGNISAIEAKELAFAMPAQDKINNEHHVKLSDFGEQNGYLVAKDNIDYLYTLRREDMLVIIADTDIKQNWKLLKIEHISNLRERSMEYELLTNQRNMGFIGRYASVKSMIIRTNGELARLLQSYEQSKSVSYQGLDILDSYHGTKETTDYNFFIDDNIRIDASKKIMLMRFRIHGGEDFLLYDKISFLVSEVQVLFPEYNCIGELV